MSQSIVLVTGANRGIGKAIVAEALQRGAARVYAAVRTLDHSLVEELGERVVPLHLDLEDPHSIARAARIASDVQIVIHNAGVLEKARPLSNNAISSLEFQIKVNVAGLLHVAQAFAPVLKANGGGSLVQLNSVASVKSFVEAATYSASKAASYSITQALREELATQGTQVISVHPGPIATDMARQAGIVEGAEPPSVVARAIFEAIEKGDFHVFPDSVARQFWGGYQSYAQTVVESASV